MSFSLNPTRRRWWPYPRLQRFLGTAAGVTALGLAVLVAPASAGDPFRPTSPRAIGAATEATVEAMFYEGNYPKAESLAQAGIQAEPAEPLNYAIAASLAYLDGDFDQLGAYAKQTQTVAKALISEDPLRGNLYTAAGIFLEGAQVLRTQGIAVGTPTALRMLQQVFSHLNEAERIDPNDPELSLLKGFMDLLLAVNLPFADPDQAIGRLENGNPEYLSQRGIALGLRDLGRYPEALVAVNNALAGAPDNPDLIYLKAQILRLNGNMGESLSFYNQAVEYVDQLPLSTVRRLRFEQCLTAGVEPGVCAERSGINEE